jgi:hypothetical protein
MSTVPEGQDDQPDSGGQADFAQAGPPSQDSEARAARAGAGRCKIKTLFDVVRRKHDCRIHSVHDRPGSQVNWVSFEVAGGGLVAVQLQHIVAIYDEQGVVKLATTAAGVHVLKDTTVQRAVMVASAAADAEAARSE